MNGWGGTYTEEEKALIRQDLAEMTAEMQAVWEKSPKRGLHPRVAALRAQRNKPMVEEE